MLRRLFQRRGTENAARPSLGGRPPSVPGGARVYVIGDIHGRLDLLCQIEQLILADLARSGRPPRLYAVYLGDYVDRGPSSRAVLDHLSRNPLPGFARVFLMGNHDLWFRDFLEGFPVGDVWLDNGGEATLASYGVELDPLLDPQERWARARLDLLDRLPSAHRTFLERLELAFGFGDYFFCHAGVRPGVPLEAQNPIDLLWIREPFLSFSGEFGKIVVHGHTPQPEPVVRPNRIGIDTGACWTGRLTCLVLEGTDYRFLTTLGGEAE
ncbi:MAG: metallophosphoesterase family protein [Geminicoccaceae bacterium]|nr:serine/threonine protein phosphatase [Geminicoccaceae bacterium]MCS7267013.1 serine/threonine protein phosphatase [Geminicoccaceae bacterium]MDW8123366.1 metallophosphoesterase family protein [Geminicoccaceae bacterium]MDW8341576.1 metallophosphoesterase family protein [Geminicoccaceae bacterium]